MQGEFSEEKYKMIVHMKETNFFKNYEEREPFKKCYLFNLKAPVNDMQHKYINKSLKLKTTRITKLMLSKNRKNRCIQEENTWQRSFLKQCKNSRALSDIKF